MNKSSSKTIVNDTNFNTIEVMNVKTLNDVPQKLNECLSLIENSFNYEEQHSYKEDFALLLQEENYKNCYFLEEEGEVAATLFTLPRTLHYKDAEVPVLFLGGISVRDDKRGGGLFKSLLETILLLNGDCAFYLLWSDLSQLYEKFSFYEFGLIEEIDLRDQSTTLQEKEIKEQAPLKESYAHLSQKFLVPLRSENDWTTLLQKSPSIKTLSDHNGNHYFVNKGMDLQDICHEYHPSDAPPAQGFINWRLTDKPESNENLRYMGFMRLGNFEVINELVTYTSNGRLRIDSYEDGVVTVIFDNNPYELQEKDFVQGLWGPGRVEEWLELMPHILIHGFDSI